MHIGFGLISVRPVGCEDVLKTTVTVTLQYDTVSVSKCFLNMQIWITSCEMWLDPFSYKKMPAIFFAQYMIHIDSDSKYLCNALLMNYSTYSPGSVMLHIENATVISVFHCTWCFNSIPVLIPSKLTSFVSSSLSSPCYLHHYHFLIFPFSGFVISIITSFLHFSNYRNNSLQPCRITPRNLSLTFLNYFLPQIKHNTSLTLKMTRMRPIQRCPGPAVTLCRSGSESVEI